MKGGAVFLTASVIAALTNYLYQVVASRQLSPREFADLSVWVANLAPFMVLSAVMQYHSNFKPASAKFLRIASVACVALGVCFLVFWDYGQEPFSLWHSVLVVVSTAMAAWLSGQTQIRLSFLLLAGGSLAIAVSRLGFVIPSWDGLETLAKFPLANLVGPVVCILLLTVGLRSAKSHPAAKDGKFWQRAIILSLAGALLPQFDMFLMGHTQAEADVIEFARAGLFGRAVYAVATIVAQWLLPNQIRGVKFGVQVSVLRVTMGLLAVCGVIGLLSPQIAYYLFSWESAPPRDLVFLASTQITLLAMLFVIIQAECAKNNIKAAAIILSVIGLEALVQWSFGLHMRQYLHIMPAIQLTTILVFTKLRSGWFS
jgi:hypothetical protein